MNKNIIIIAPHPDDDVIGMGGTIHNLYKSGHNINIIYATNGSGTLKLGKYKNFSKTQIIKERRSEAINSINKLCGKNHKIKQIFFGLESKDIKNLFEDKLNQFLKKNTQKNKSYTFYIPHEKEMHVTHKLITKLSLKTIKQYKNQCNIFEYEVWTSLQMNKNTLICDISNCIKNKQNAIIAHKTQCLILPFDEGIICKNKYNAIFSKINTKKLISYAEIFKPQKH